MNLDCKPFVICALIAFSISGCTTELSSPDTTKVDPSAATEHVEHENAFELCLVGHVRKSIPGMKDAILGITGPSPELPIADGSKIYIIPGDGIQSAKVSYSSDSEVGGLQSFENVPVVPCSRDENSSLCIRPSASLLFQFDTNSKTLELRSSSHPTRGGGQVWRFESCESNSQT